MAQAFWVHSPGNGGLRTVAVPEPGPDEVLVDTLYSAISKGSESLVLHGRVPVSQYDRMRAPFQDGDFPFPVKYGYLNVGVVRDGPESLRGATVFCLYPHQTEYVVPAAAVTPLPESVPARRAVLAGTVETAVNALWDMRPRIGDHVAVVGAGMVGCSVAAVLAGFPGVRVQLVDTDTDRAKVAAALGVEFTTPQEARTGCDHVVHASATGAGLAQCFGLVTSGTEVIELSWYGDRPVTIPLGEDFHSRRLGIRASQVGTVAHPNRGFEARLRLAVELLADPVFDTLITGESRFAMLPEIAPGIVAGDGLCHRISYPAAEE